MVSALLGNGNSNQIDEDVDQERKKRDGEKKIRALQLLVFVRGDALVRFAREVGRIEIRMVDFGFEHENGKPQTRQPQRNGQDKNDGEPPHRNASQQHQARFDVAERKRGKIDRLRQRGDDDELLCRAFKRFDGLFHRAARRFKPKAVERSERRRLNRRRITAHVFSLHDKRGQV